MHRALSVPSEHQVHYRPPSEMHHAQTVSAYRPRVIFVNNHLNDARLSVDHEAFLSKFIRFIALLPEVSRPRTVISFKTIYIDYHLQNPLKKMSPSATIRNLVIFFKVLYKKQSEIHYIERFNLFKPQLGEIHGGSVVTKADLNVLQGTRKELENNRCGAWASSVEDEMLATLRDNPCAIAYDDETLHMSQETNHMLVLQVTCDIKDCVLL